MLSGQIVKRSLHYWNGCSHFMDDSFAGKGLLSRGQTRGRGVHLEMQGLAIGAIQ
jgi:hypothetical protein